MKNKEFIPYEEALALRELGFDETCVMYWGSEMDGSMHLFCHQDNYFPDSIGSNNSDNAKWVVCTAPLYQQVFSWLREEHSLYHNIWNCTHGELTDKIPYGFAFSIDEDWTCIVGKKDGLFEKYYNTYEEAEQACLVKLIQLVKKKTSHSNS